MSSIDDPNDSAKKPTIPTHEQAESELPMAPPASEEANPIDEAPSRPDHPGRSRFPAIAFRSDGKALLSVTYLEGADLTGREQCTFVVLTEAEASCLIDRLSQAADDAAGNVAGSILWKNEEAKE